MAPGAVDDPEYDASGPGLTLQVRHDRLERRQAAAAAEGNKSSTDRRILVEAGEHAGLHVVDVRTDPSELAAEAVVCLTYLPHDQFVHTLQRVPLSIAGESLQHDGASECGAGA